MSLRIDILTLFPEMFGPFLGTSIPKRAEAKGLVGYHLHDIRAVATDPHKSVDDKPFGGGPGMVMMAPIIVDAVERAEAQDPRPATRILLTPQGRVFDQSVAQELSGKERLLFLSGRYEGLDERVIDELAPLELSIGDYVLSGGELAAMVIIDAVVRLLPGALGAETGAEDETFADGLLEYPQYTRRASTAAKRFRTCSSAVTIKRSRLGGRNSESNGRKCVDPICGRRTNVDN
ncbi:MAG: tRNA (guanosine(37)-N1)-methyltransferase TrmD [Tepidisphaeraceae bacterium]